MSDEQFSGAWQESEMKFAETANDADGREIFHYTSPEGMKGIIESKSLRFSDRSNHDNSEGIYLLKLVKDNTDKIFDGIEVPGDFLSRLGAECDRRLENPMLYGFYCYQCAFSTESDSKCMWEYYTKSGGIKSYSLRFNSLELKHDLESGLNENISSKFCVWCGSVIYDKKDQLEQLHAIAEKFMSLSAEYPAEDMGPRIARLLNVFLRQGIFFKSSSFQEEREYRMTIFLYINEKGEYITETDKEKAEVSARKFIEQKNGLRKSYAELYFDPKCLKSITISPMRESFANGESLTALIEKDFSHLLSSGDGIVKSEHK